MRTTVNVVATVRARTAEEGGRRSPLFSGYRATTFFSEESDSGYDAMLTFLGADRLELGKVGMAQVRFLKPHLVQPFLHPGHTFTLREGPRVVAEGTVTKVSRTPASTRGD